MRLLALDGRMGASGDMLLAALLAAGADRDALAPVEDALDVRYETGETTKNGIRATTVTVLLDDEHPHDTDRSHGEAHSHDHGEAHDHTHESGHSHQHDHDHAPAEGHGPSRTYAEVIELVESMGLPADVEADAFAVFERLGRAESRVHGTDLAETHFHEVGADDAIADVVGVCLLLADLGVERVVTTPLAAGGGEVSMSHGTYPVPTPAVTYLAEDADWALRGGPVEAELLTPTGAAILSHVAEGVDSLPSLRVERVGYGAGGYTFPEHPNVLRATVGESGGALRRDPVRVLETNVDDASPELLGGLQETLLDAGARDVSVVPLTMKKSRPGHLVKVVVKPENSERVARLLAEETGTLGVRETGVRHRFVADRRIETATLLEDGERHTVRVKVASDADGTAFDVSAEYDDAAAVAAETGLATREVARRAEQAAREGGALTDRLVHVVEADRWAEVGDGEPYAPSSLDAEGFVHASTPAWVVPVAQANYADAEEPLLLVLDRSALDPEIRYEEQPLGAFPHVYGPVNAAAVVDVLPFPREDGRFVLPEELE